jgi:hypothetical protein
MSAGSVQSCASCSTVGGVAGGVIAAVAHADTSISASGNRIALCAPAERRVARIIVVSVTCSTG